MESCVQEFLQRSPLDARWAALLAEELEQPYFAALCRAVTARRAAGPVYPPEADVFSAFALTPPERVRCVILGQDPYHEPEQAHGLAFSVRPGVPLPRSLRNIYKEREADLGLPPAQTGCLIPWARAGQQPCKIRLADLHRRGVPHPLAAAPAGGLRAVGQAGPDQTGASHRRPRRRAAAGPYFGPSLAAVRQARLFRQPAFQPGGRLSAGERRSSHRLGALKRNCMPYLCDIFPQLCYNTFNMLCTAMTK